MVSQGTSAAGTVHVDPTTAKDLAKAVLVSYGVPSDRAEMVATALVQADLRGVDTHGVNRLPGYIERLKAKVVDPAPDLDFVQKTPVMAQLDAKNTFGFVAGHLAVEKGVEMARTYGIGMVGVKHSNHFGMAATYILQAVRQGFACFAFTNASRAMPPWGGREALLGTSPFAVGIPGGEEGDFVIDMSPSVAARGKIRKADRRGEKIPEGYALDKTGKSTTDPKAALDGGVVLPIGGPKGSGLSHMMDLFGGIMTGAALTGSVNDQYKNLQDPQDVGHWFLVFRPEVFLDGGMDELRARMDVSMKTVRECSKAEGFERIYTSGEIEADMQKKREKEGIPFTVGEVETLNRLAADVGVDIRLG